MGSHREELTTAWHRNGGGITEHTGVSSWMIATRNHCLSPAVGYNDRSRRIKTFVVGSCVNFAHIVLVFVTYTSNHVYF
jgi:hypothetical protein